MGIDQRGDASAMGTDQHEGTASGASGVSGAPAASADLARIMESARRLGVRMDETAALQWLGAMAAAQIGGDVVVDTADGVFGGRAPMLDFSPRDLARYREIGRLVGLPDRPGTVETALALAGSGAQSKIQSYPGDCDYFERVNILAPSREEACRIVADLMRDQALGAARGETYELLSIKIGSYPEPVVRAGVACTAGRPIAWTLEDLRAGRIEAFRPDGTPVELRWEDVTREPGLCKLDWVVADPERGGLSSASNMLDVTWEAPDGTITPLDGLLDPYFQEVYLDAASLPVFSKLVRHMADDGQQGYLSALEGEVRKYLGPGHLNYGKVAKRLYNIFRLTGRYEEACYLRELFHQEATALYQVWSLLGTLEEAVQPDASIPPRRLLDEVDELILAVTRELTGDKAAEIVRHLLHLRDCVAQHEDRATLDAETAASRAGIIDVVNAYFYERLAALPSIVEYIETMRPTPQP